MSMEQSGNERMASMQSMRKIWFRGRSWTSTGFDFTAGLIFSMTPTAHSSKLNETAMSQRGGKVKDVHNIRIHRESRDQGPFRWNERSPAQDMESGDSEGTQPVVVLPE
jgi:hypothetical protein